MLAGVVQAASGRIPLSARSSFLATPNYSYEKRQRELAKKRKNEEKRQRKLSPRSEDGSAPADDAPEGADGAAPATDSAPPTPAG